MSSIERITEALASRYTLTAPIGEGGMASVWLARDVKLGRDVALKVLKPSLAAGLGVSRFLREVEVTAALHHPRILPLFDSGEAEGVPWYAMPYVPGESLRDRISREGRLPVADAVEIARQVAAAVAHAHSKEVVHRDLKPENILLHDGNAYVADFGIALALERADEGRLTDSGVQVGTPLYMSPEQAAGEKNVDGRSDQWALGAILYEMLTGEPPHRGETVQALVMRILVEPPTSVRVVRPGVPKALDDVVMRALQKVPADRFPTTQAFDSALAGAITSGDAIATPITADTAQQTVFRRRRMIGVLGAVLVGFVAVGMVTFRSFRSSSTDISNPSVVIAVIPCEDRTASSELSYVAEGLSENLVNRLTTVSRLRVLPRGIVRAASQPAVAPTSVAEKLGATHFVTCSVARAGTGLRIGAQLVQANPARELWGAGFVSSASEVLAIEDSLLRAFVASVPVQVSADERSRLTAGDTRDGEAQRLFMLGRHHWHRMSLPEMQTALRYFEQALARDSTFARAYAGIAMVHIGMGVGVGVEEPRIALARAHAALERGLAVRPGDPDLLAIRAMAFMWHDRDLDAARRDANAALAAGPELAVTNQTMQHVLASEGKLDSALLFNAVAQQLEPTHARLITDRATYQFLARNFRETTASADEAIALDAASVTGYLWRAYAAAMLGDTTRARAALAQIASFVRGTPSIASERAVILGLLGDRVSARALIDSVMSQQGRLEPTLLAAAWGLIGEPDLAFEWLNRAANEGSRWLFTMEVDPRFDALRTDPRFDAFVRRIRAGG